MVSISMILGFSDEEIVKIMNDDKSENPEINDNFEKSNDNFR